MQSPRPSETPFIAKPDMLDSPPDLVCFISMNRVCCADCIAYTVNTPGAEYNDPWGHCLCLSSLARISKHVVVLAQQAETQTLANKKLIDDIARTTSGPSVQPFVPPTPKVSP